MDSPSRSADGRRTRENALYGQAAHALIIQALAEMSDAQQSAKPAEVLDLCGPCGRGYYGVSWSGRVRMLSAKIAVAA